MSQDGSYIRRMSHGGWCCGMSHIHNFPDFGGPDDVLKERVALDSAAWDQMVQKQTCRIFEVNESYPEQTAGERFIEAVRRSVRDREGGILEVVLSSEQTDAWESLVLSQGFTLVNECRNSNTDNMIFVYHRNCLYDMDEDDMDEEIMCDDPDCPCCD